MRYILGIIAIIFAAAIAIILIVGHNPLNNRNAPKPNIGVNLLNYDNGSSTVSYTIQGQLVGENQRQSVRVSVNQSQRTIDLLTGYENNVARSQSFANTPDAYTYFLHGINSAGFSKARVGVFNDEKGFCPTGNVYIYELSSENKSRLRTWSDSCATRDGTFVGNAQLIRTLFTNQITGYTNFIGGTTIYN